MSNEMLSQDEIDALLRQTIDEQENFTVDINQYLTPMEQDALGEIGNISFGSASTALSTLLGTKVEITTPTVSVIERKNLANEFPTPYVAVYVQYTDGIQGTNVLVIKSSDAKIIADLMMGGSGQVLDDNLTEMDISAVQEAMNQMMGSSATSMSTIFNTKVDISPPGIDILNLTEGKGEENIPNDDILIKVSFRLRIGTLIDSNIMQITTVDLAKKMVGQLLGTDTSSTTPTKSYNLQENNNDYDSSYHHDVIDRPKEIEYQSKPMDHYEKRDTYYHSSRNVTNKEQVNQNPKIQTAQFADFDSQKSVKNLDPNLEILMDIPLQITVELGRTKKMIKEILELAQGSIIELDKLAGEPVDILANNKLIAKGEVVVIDENFGVRVTDIISQSDRIRKLQ
ncbi:flagellar motor switch phosphatase FliY [Tepidibacillus sp. LV47]|uniref:flagellar motor switch phosphatase FliY n=1 Tax=Tepidibacillus sp. LV47 TaxID=3398228 RepID=UPI003AAB3D7A